MGPQVEVKIEALRRSGQLRILAGPYHPSESKTGWRQRVDSSARRWGGD
jgi:hypothetical protein